MKINKTKTLGLAELVRKIDNNLELVKRLGEGGYGIVLVVNQNNKKYRLKISKSESLEREYVLFEDLTKTKAGLMPIKLYNNVPSVQIDKTETPYKFKEGDIGKNAYLTEFKEGKILTNSQGEFNDFELKKKLRNLVHRIHQAGYEFGPDSDFNANNVLITEDGNFYLIDPLKLLPKRNKTEDFYMTDEEKARISTMVAMRASR